MKQLIEKLLTFLHMLVSRLGFSAGTASSNDRPAIERDEVKPSRSVESVRQEATRESVQPQVSGSDSEQTTQGYRSEGADTEASDGGSSGLGKTLTTVGDELDSDAQPHGQSDDSPHESGDGTVEPQTMKPMSNRNPNDASDNAIVDESAGATTGPPPTDESTHETPASPQLDTGTSDSSESDGASIDSGELCAGGSEQVEGVLSASACEQDSSDSDLNAEAPSGLVSDDQYSQGDLADEADAAPSDEQAVLEFIDADRSPTEQEHSKLSGESCAKPMDAGVTRSPRRPAPMEDAGQYEVVVRDVSVVDQEYARWNNVVVEQLLLAKAPTEDVYLCVNPRILARVFGEAGFDMLTPDQAEQRFSAATANVYRKRVLGHTARLHVLRRCGDDGSPDCVAFLAASVLAAYRMQSDEGVSGSAYYKRLADLLGCKMQGAHPVGFNPSVFESLWLFLRNWLHEVHGRRLAMPTGEIGLRRFVALPLAHVPLRSLDIEKLPAFFVWAGYQPGDRVRRGRLLADLRLWQQSKNTFTPTGSEALSDDRSDAVLAQVSAELESWDGSFSESTSRRSALVEIQFDIVQRSPVISYLPRRPPGFPGVFDDGEHVFEASDEGWYDPAPIRPADGELLERGFEWRSHVNDIQFVLRRSEALVVALTPSSSYSGFLSSRRLLRGVKCSVLCRDKVIDRVVEYLSEAAQQRLNAVTHPLLPTGWSIIRDFTAQIHVEAPSGLETLEVDPNIELLVTGGLRIGRRWSWLTGAPPQILVSGVEANDQVKVNGASIKVGLNGELLLNEALAQPGEYLIEAGRMRRRIEVVQPQVSVRDKAERNASPSGSRSIKIALPQGSWTLIGSSPDQICSFHGGFFRGTLASCPFQPSWAIQVGAGPGSSVAVFTKPGPPRKVGFRSWKQQPRNLIEQWASVIYQAHIRRPRFVGVNGMVPNEEVVAIWKQYASAAKQIKRGLKRK